jgi:hypothetical protein
MWVQFSERWRYNMKSAICILLSWVIVIYSQSAQADSSSLLNQAQLANSARYQFALANNAEIRATSDNKSFTLWWQPGTGSPEGVIVTLHGHGSYATDSFYMWQPYAQSKGYAMLALQWWFGSGDATADYYQPTEMYPIIAKLLTEKAVRPGTVLFEGFSRGSANSYAVTALDTASGNRFFGMTLSNAGGAMQDYPPNQQIVAGAYGALPFTGVKWIMYCGEKDPDPTINGCEGMKAAQSWVIQYGADFKLLIDDPNGDHGGFMTNSANVSTALAQFSPSVNRTLYLVAGWNLLGNSVNAPLNVVSTFNDASKIASVWKWVPSSGKWALYSPLLTSQALSDYAASHNLDVLSTINSGEGFWVNAQAAVSALLPDAAPLAAASMQSAWATGWNLATSGEPFNPANLDVTSLWAWDANHSAWYFYAPALNASGELASYLQSKGYLDFATAGKKLTQGVGFWVKKADNSNTTPQLAAPTQVSVTAYSAQTLGTRTIASSTQLSVSWTAPAGTVDHYEITATEAVQNTSLSFSSKASPAILSGLKSATPYSITVKSCADAACKQSATANAAGITTDREYWQLQGSGNTVSGLGRIVSDANVLITATRFGAQAGATNASRLQLYYTSSTTHAPAIAVTGQATDAAVPASYLSFTSLGSLVGIKSPATPTSLVASVGGVVAVPLTGGAVRLFFDPTGSDGKSRIVSIDSQDGYAGRDFNTGSASTCSTFADYSSAGGCAPNVMIGVQGDSVNPNNKIAQARQFKLGWPTLSDWRWDQAAGTFMVFTTDSIVGCSASGMNQAYATWNGASWAVQYASDGCPKLFKSTQAAFPMHLGGARYKLYYGDPSLSTGKLAGDMPFLGPKKLIYADGALSGSASAVDFEDWENQAFARDVVFLWPNGEQLDATAEGYIDDYQFLAPTGSLGLQVMYLAITDGQATPFGASAVLLNP